MKFARRVGWLGSRRKTDSEGNALEEVGMGEAKLFRVSSKFCGQATKGAWWMPWQKQAMKDVASCDKPRGAASRL
jgi:hypothetical protein